MDDDFAEPKWPGRVARACFCLAILAGAVWWLVIRERPLPPRQRLAVVRDSAQRASARHIAADHLQHADASVVPELVRTLKDGDALGRELAAVALGRLGHKAGAAAEALVQAANDPAASVREQAILALGRMAKARELSELLASDDDDVRRRAVIELGQMRFDAEPFAPALRKALADPNAYVRAEAYAALWKLSAIGTRDVTAGLTGDPDRIVRRTIVILLARLPDPAPQMLMPALDDADPLVRITALEELGGMGAAAEPVVTAIASLLESQDEKTVVSAALALGKIGAQTNRTTGALIEWSDEPRHTVSQTGRESDIRPRQPFDALHAEVDTTHSLNLANLTSRPATDLLPGAAAEPVACSDTDMQHVKRLRHLRFLNLANNPVSDAGLAEIADLKELERLDLGRTRVTSQGLTHLGGLLELRTLRLSYCAVDDEGLAELAKVQSLEELFLDGTLVTDAGMAHLAKLGRLKWVALEGTNVTDAGLELLKSLETLEEISFSPEQVSLAGLVQLPALTRIMATPTSITDADLSSLAALKRLKTLVLSGASISDAGMASVGRLASLESLFLNDIPITDAGLEQLKSLTNLRSLCFSGILVSQQAVYRLMGSLPELTIEPSSDTASTLRIGYEVIGLKSIADIR